MLSLVSIVVVDLTSSCSVASSRASVCFWMYATEPGPNAGVGGSYGFTVTAALPAGISACRSDVGGTGWNETYPSHTEVR